MPEHFGIEALASLRETLSSISKSHIATMRNYASSDGKGFRHNPVVGDDKASLASTVTCVSSLVRADRWNFTLEPNRTRVWGTSEAVAANLIVRLTRALEKAKEDRTQPEETASGGLGPTNPFSLAFLAEGVLDFRKHRYNSYDAHIRQVQEHIIPLLEEAISREKKLDAASESKLDAAGSVRIDPYPPSAYLTQLAYRVLKVAHEVTPSPNFEAITEQVRGWSRAELNRQMVLINIGSRTADPMQLAYTIILVSETSSEKQSTPEEKALTTAALKLFFSRQNPDGSWPPSQPLFHYPDVGNAQCFEYELLTQMLICKPLQKALLNHFLEFKRAVDRLGETAYQLEKKSPGEEPIAWASGHHPQIEGPESWSTACVYDFAHTLGRLVAEAIRRALFAEVSVEYSAPVPPEQKTPDKFDVRFLDTELFVDGRALGLTQTLLDTFVAPIKNDRSAVSNGGKLDSKTPMSAILFGPPGTSKTELAKMIAKCVGWPLLSVDPSYLVQDGLDKLYSRANKLFSMLSITEEVVAFLDEFDEMGRERTDNAEISSRFITTAMLPKLAAINKSRQIIIILATNYIANFDAAFSRGGRFDMIVQVMTPTSDEKLRNPDWSRLKEVVEATKELDLPEAKTAVADLTYLETIQLVARLEHGGKDALQELFKAAKGGTLARQHGPEDTWKTISIKQREHIRLPAYSRLPPSSEFETMKEENEQTETAREEASPVVTPGETDPAPN